MGKILLYFFISLLVIFSLVEPYFGVSSYYFLAILGPQYIWWWVFGHLRISFIVGFVTLLSIFLKIIQRKCDFGFLFTKMNLFVFGLWVCLLISYLLGPYVDNPQYKIFPPQKVFVASIKIFLFYLFSTLAIDSYKKLRFFPFVFVFSVIYLTYWANLQYINQNWSQFNFGRLQGPRSIWGSSIYYDENTFAMVFVTGLPFLVALPFLFKEYFNSLIKKLLAWIPVPFAVHAIFLTGSRGGLLGLLVVSLIPIIFSKRKILILLIIPLLYFFYYWQAGDVMKQRFQTVSEYHEESSAQQRLKAWKGAWRMIKKYPFTGVGLSSFITALPDFYPTSPRVAHNTLIEFTAESGIFAGMFYLLIIFSFFKNAFYVRRVLFSRDDFYFLYVLNSATFVSFCGLVVCSMFLSLNYYEIFFYLLLINNNLAVLAKRAVFG